MIRITQWRNKCIGCHVCVEIADYRWRMNRRDGKSTLIGGQRKKDVHHFIADDHELEDVEIAAEACPVKIIKVVKI